MILLAGSPGYHQSMLDTRPTMPMPAVQLAVDSAASNNEEIDFVPLASASNNDLIEVKIVSTLRIHLPKRQASHQTRKMSEKAIFCSHAAAPDTKTGRHYA